MKSHLLWSLPILGCDITYVSRSQGGKSEHFDVMWTSTGIETLPCYVLQAQGGKSERFDVMWTRKEDGKAPHVADGDTARSIVLLSHFSPSSLVTRGTGSLSCGQAPG